MILTENINLTDSMLFLLSTRDIIKEVVEMSSIEHKDTVKNFVMNEASDYQIMSLLIDGVLPEEKYNVGEEMLLFSRLKEQVVFNYPILSEAIGEDLTRNLIFEVGPISPDYSSAAPIAEFLASQRTLEQRATRGGSGPGEETLKKALKGVGRAAVTTGTRVGKAGAPAVATFLKGLPGAAAVGTKLGGASAVAGGGAIALGGLAAAAILIYASVKTYKRFWSQAAKACKGKSGKEKTACLLTYRAKAFQAQIADLSRGLNGCAKTKDPAKCSKSVAGKLTSLKKKLAKMKK